MSDPADNNWLELAGKAARTELAPAEARFRRGYALIWGFAVLLLALTWFAVRYQTVTERELEIATVSRDNLNLARAFEEHTVRTLKSVDQTVLFLKYQYEKIGEKLDIRDHVREGMIINTLFNQIGVIDENGIYVLSSLPNHKPIDLSDREHFKVHRDTDSGQLFVSKPVLGRASGKWSLQLTRRINKPDGSFGGVVVISVDPFYFTRFYSDVDLGRGGVVTLVGTDGVVRARRADGEDSIGQNLNGSSLTAAAEKADFGTFVADSRIDGKRRIFAFRRLKDYPLMVLVGKEESNALEPYYQRVSTYVGFGAIVSLVIVAFALAASWLVWRQQRISASLAESRKRAEEANRLKSEFLASVSHELRTPLNGIIGYAELLRDNASQDECNLQFASTILESGQQLLGMVNRILTLASIEAGRLMPDIGAHEIGPLLADVKTIQQAAANEKGLALEVEMAPGAPAKVWCDPARLLEVLNDLVGNAVKFTESGKVKLKVAAAGGKARFSVSDTGPGIPLEAQKVIFEKFRQAEGSFLTRRHQGAGLGLALAYQLVHLMGGVLQVESEEGRGSTFHFTLPAAGPMEGK
ncbi:MAG: two-component sensor histidine kinase [Zoogloea sp.]|nr:two-component sensor histidine kinase [Zoogloea sp.]